MQQGRSAIIGFCLEAIKYLCFVKERDNSNLKNKHFNRIQSKDRLILYLVLGNDGS